MTASGPVILIACITTTVGWCVFVWMKPETSAWTWSSGGAFLIGAAGGMVWSLSEQMSAAEALFLAALYGALSAAVIATHHFSIWLRDKGVARRERKTKS